MTTKPETAAEICNAHGFLAMRARQHQAAVMYLEAAAAALPVDHPSMAVTMNNLGLVYTRTDRITDAVQAYRAALAIKPDFIEARYGRAVAELTRGNLGAGWPLYTARHRRKGNPIAGRSFTALPLVGRPPAGLSLLAWADQGMGDQIMFASLIPDLLAAGVILTVECDARLRPVLAKSFPAARVVSFVPNISLCFAGPHAAHVSLADTAAWLRPSFAAFPARRSYLRADIDATARYRSHYRAFAAGKPIVGLSWQSAVSAKTAAEKSVPIEHWDNTLRAPAAFVNLQYGDPAPFIYAAKSRTGARILHQPGVDLANDMEDFAARVAACDLVISTSSVTAHMAGALGVPVWCLAAKGMGGMWHWFQGREDSPWYPSMRLFRQRTAGDWMPPACRVGAALQTFVQHRGNA